MTGNGSFWVVPITFLSFLLPRCMLLLVRGCQQYATCKSQGFLQAHVPPPNKHYHIPRKHSSWKKSRWGGWPGEGVLPRESPNSWRDLESCIWPLGPRFPNISPLHSRLDAVKIHHLRTIRYRFNKKISRTMTSCFYKIREASHLLFRKYLMILFSLVLFAICNCKRLLELTE